MLSRNEQRLKRMFDIVLSAIGITITLPILLIAWIIASIESQSNGLFIQQRVGRDGKFFKLYKIKTMKPIKGVTTTVTTALDNRIMKSGAYFRKTKIDELPQLVNVLFGTMSLVGPRPDVPGYADTLHGEERIILEIAPGITGPASLKYKDEEQLLAEQNDPQRYNNEVIWPDKVRINMHYVNNWSLQKDILYLYQTIAGH